MSTAAVTESKTGKGDIVRDAGPKEAATGASSADRSKLLLWVSGAVAVFLVIAVLISLS